MRQGEKFLRAYLYSTVCLYTSLHAKYICYAGASMTLMLICLSTYFHKHNVTFKTRLGTNDLKMKSMRSFKFKDTMTRWHTQKGKHSCHDTKHTEQGGTRKTIVESNYEKCFHIKGTLLRSGVLKVENCLFKCVTRPDFSGVPLTFKLRSNFKRKLNRYLMY